MCALQGYLCAVRARVGAARAGLWARGGYGQPIYHVCIEHLTKPIPYFWKYMYMSYDKPDSKIEMSLQTICVYLIIKKIVSIYYLTIKKK
jgi:hypothetical protein